MVGKGSHLRSQVWTQLSVSVQQNLNVDQYFKGWWCAPALLTQSLDDDFDRSQNKKMWFDPLRWRHFILNSPPNPSTLACSLMENVHLFPRKQPPPPPFPPQKSTSNFGDRPCLVFCLYICYAERLMNVFQLPMTRGTCVPSPWMICRQAVVHHHKCRQRSSERSSQFCLKTAKLLTFDRINSILLFF